MIRRAPLGLAFALSLVLAPYLSSFGSRFFYPGAEFAYSSDPEPPNIAILSPKNKTYCVDSVALTFALREAPSWIAYSLDGEANVTIDGYSVIADLSVGSHGITVYVNNSFGVTSRSKTIHFAIDTVPPSVTILSPEENKTYTTNAVLLKFAVDEETSWSGYSLDEQQTVASSEDLNLTELSQGHHSLVVYAKDIAGNTGASETIYFNVAANGPDAFQLWILAVIVVTVAAGSTILIYRLKTRKRINNQPTNGRLTDA